MCNKASTAGCDVAGVHAGLADVRGVVCVCHDHYAVRFAPAVYQHDPIRDLWHYLNRAVNRTLSCTSVPV